MKRILMMVVFLTVTLTLCAEGGLSDETSLYMGATALDIYAPVDGTTTVGGRYFLDDVMAVNVGVSLNAQEEDKDVEQASGGKLKVSLGIDYYLIDARVAPYLKAGGGLGYAGGDKYESEKTDGFLFDFYGGAGAEFFIVKQFSVGGEALVRMQVAPSFVMTTLTPSIRASFFFDLI